MRKERILNLIGLAVIFMAVGILIRESIWPGHWLSRVAVGVGFLFLNAIGCLMVCFSRYIRNCRLEAIEQSEPVPVEISNAYAAGTPQATAHDPYGQIMRNQYGEPIGCAVHKGPLFGGGYCPECRSNPSVQNTYTMRIREINFTK